MIHLQRSPVLSLRASYDNIEALMPRLGEVLPVAEIAAARKIAIKINLCDARTAETGTITHPRFLDALLGWLRRENPGAEILLTESDGIAVLADHYRKWFGVDAVLARWDARWINLSREPVDMVKIAGRHMDEVPVPRVLSESFLVSLSKLKTNLVSTITCALKNQFGCLPTIDKFKYHGVLADVIHDVNLAIRPGAFIVDGIVAQGGIQGPAFGIPIRAGVVLAGTDPVALDAAACTLLGYHPLAVAHVRACWRSGRGSLRYRIVGDPLPKVDFENHGFEIEVFRMGGRIKRFYQRLDRRRSA